MKIINNKYTLLFLIASLFLQSCNNKPFCEVKGRISGVEEESTIYVLQRVGEFEEDTITQSIINSNGEFSFILPNSSNNLFYELRVAGNRSSVAFIAEKGTIEINGELKTLYASDVTGTPENIRWNSYQEFIREQSKAGNELSMNRDKYTQEERVAAFNEMKLQKEEYTDSVINNYPNSIVSLYLAKMPLPMLKHNEIEGILSHFKPYFENHIYFKEIQDRYDSLIKVSVGMEAPDFTVFREDGETSITLSEFRGKYVLLDFWASWCAPCRIENKHTKELYEKYSSQGLEFISFSLDSDINAWTNAIETDEIVWNNASDLVGGVLSPVAQDYGIEAIPAIWILDPDGKVIGDNVRGEELTSLLESIFTSQD